MSSLRTFQKITCALHAFISIVISLCTQEYCCNPSDVNAVATYMMDRCKQDGCQFEEGTSQCRNAPAYRNCMQSCGHESVCVTGLSQELDGEYAFDGYYNRGGKAPSWKKEGVTDYYLYWHYNQFYISTDQNKGRPSNAMIFARCSAPSNLGFENPDDKSNGGDCVDNTWYYSPTNENVDASVKLGVCTLTTLEPTSATTLKPTFLPTEMPSVGPSELPTYNPSWTPTLIPTKKPTTVMPTLKPTAKPTKTLSISPTNNPLSNPYSPPISTDNPTKNPTYPTVDWPAFAPTMTTNAPSSHSTSIHPTQFPSTSPSNSQSVHPTPNPSSNPSANPTYSPSKNPTMYPSSNPSMRPTLSTFFQPTEDNPILHISLTKTTSNNPNNEEEAISQTSQYVSTQTTSSTLSAYKEQSFDPLIITISVSVTALSCAMCFILMFIAYQMRQKQLTTDIHANLEDVASASPEYATNTKESADCTHTNKCTNTPKVSIKVSNSLTVIKDHLARLTPTSSADMEVAEMYNKMMAIDCSEGYDLENTTAHVPNCNKTRRGTMSIENNIIYDGSEQLEIREWLSANCGQEICKKYFCLFISNGYQSLDFIKEIQTKKDLDEIGIKLKGHQTAILSAIRKLKNDIT